MLTTIITTVYNTIIYVTYYYNILISSTGKTTQYLAK